jgi:hypothetical protein
MDPTTTARLLDYEECHATAWSQLEHGCIEEAQVAATLALAEAIRGVGRELVACLDYHLKRA